MDKKIIKGHPHIKFEGLNYSASKTLEQSGEFYQLMDQRRSVRDISDREVPEEVIIDLIMTASSAPSGAHKQPWSFCAVSAQEVKNKIRDAAEKEEYKSYHGRMSDRWLKDLQPIGTDWHKPFLSSAPWLIVVFKKIYDINTDKKANNYYVNESVGIACGILIAAIHHAGLVTLTHTPSPMHFLSEILNRPANERPFLLLPVGYPEKEAFIPDLKRKKVEDVATFYR